MSLYCRLWGFGLKWQFERCFRLFRTIKTQALYHTDTQTEKDSVADYLVRAIGIHLYHVLSSLFDFELDVILFLQCSQATAVGACPSLAAGGVWGHGALGN